MKKHLLLNLTFWGLLCFLGQGLSAQITGPDVNKSVKPINMHPDQTSYYENPASKQDVRADIIIGTTWYDGQALNYGNLMQRVWAYPDGSVGATWISAGENLNPERGCGYNYFDGTSWGTANPHVGPIDRMGTPSYAPWGPNGEIITQYKYVAGAGPLKFYKRETKGEGEWQEVSLQGPTGVSLVWQSMITSGENHEHIHVLAYTYDIPYMGQESALLYYRSSDGGETWDVNGEIIEGLGEDYFAKINSLSYAWANPVGNTIAFTYGFDEFGGRVFKSYDNGDNWEMVEVYNSPFSSLDPPAESTVFPCGIGTSACALDSDGNVHVVFARMRRIFVEGSANYYPYTDGLIYWNETMPMLDTTTISSYTLDFLEAGGNLIGSLGDLEIPGGQPTYNNALWGFPQISIDADNNLFVAASSLTELSNGEYLYRHIFVNGSFDGGHSWEGMVDVDNDVFHIFSECAFPAMAPVIDDQVHIVYQIDNFPGMHEWAEEHDIVQNNIAALSLDKSIFVGIDAPAAPMSYQLSDGYPNPANRQVAFSLKLDQSVKVRIQVSNLMGQVISEVDNGLLSAGNHSLTLDVNSLPTGTYLCTIEVDQQKLIKKILVAR